jgi:putative Ca2+/H+ antiporter (TMEM165/GDT1 family)
VDLGVATTAFAVVLPVELPDKTFVATLLLATRFRPAYVWPGVTLAFGVQCAVAVVAGGLLSLLPETAVGTAAALLFLVGAVVLWRGSGAADEDADADVADADADVADEDVEQPSGPSGPSGVGALPAMGTSFVVLFLAEWGDLSQLFTAGLAARTGEPVSVFAGSWLALATVATLALVAGRGLLRVVPLPVVRRGAAVVCLLVAAVTAAGVLRAA